MSWNTTCHCGAVSVRLAKAPEEVVEEQRERKADLEAMSTRLATALKRLET